MRTIGIVLLFPLLATAQTPPNSALVRGVILECDSQSPAGELSVRAADNQVFRYQFDRKTYVEREERLIEATRLVPGERVEVVSDRVPGFTLRYARTIHVLQPTPPPRPPAAARPRPYRPSVDQVATGNMTFSGVVVRLNGERVILHTREAGDKSILLRQDTRYLANGEVVDFAALQPNMRVFVRAGKNLYDQVEAYQVIWGQILSPR